MFQTNAAVGGKVQLPMVECTVREGTIADVVKKRSRQCALRCDMR